tara:strand:+ start:283 stop:597 length:315 start_codon:yes stop_codon:yes gene_type:complete
MTDEKQGAEVPKKTRNRGPNKPKVESKITEPISEKVVIVDEPEFVREAKNRNEAATYKVYLKGEELWFTKIQIQIGIQRNIDIKIPEGSPFDVPVSSRCSNCGG